MADGEVRMRMAVFERIGRDHDVEPMLLSGDDPRKWCEDIEWYARRFLGSREIEVDLYPGPPTVPDRGTITVGMARDAGTFRIEVFS